MTNLESLHSYNIDVDNRRIYLTSYKEVEAINPQSAATFCKNLDYLVSINHKPIEIIMLSVEGGCWYSGMAIYEYIAKCPCYITISSFSLLCSMGTIILQAGDYRQVCENMAMMIHFGSSEYSGEFLAVKSFAEFQKDSHNKMLDIYASRCINGPYFENDTLNKVKNYLRSKIKDKGDLWMNAEEVINYGFADAIL